MHARRREQIGIGRGGDDCRGAAGGQPRNVDARRVSRMIAQDRSGYSGNQRRLAGPTDLVGALEPVPASVGVRGQRLGWIGHQKAELLGQGVHPRPCREIIRRLPAAVQHHDERHRGAGLGTDFRLRRDIELVAALALIARIAGKLERRAARNGRLDARRGRTRRHPTCFDPGNGLGQTFARFSTALGFRALASRISLDRLGRGWSLSGRFRAVAASSERLCRCPHIAEAARLQPWPSRA